jgi:hypothetical protein
MRVRLIALAKHWEIPLKGLYLAGEDTKGHRVLSFFATLAFTASFQYFRCCYTTPHFSF